MEKKDIEEFDIDDLAKELEADDKKYGFADNSIPGTDITEETLEEFDINDLAEELEADDKKYGFKDDTIPVSKKRADKRNDGVRISKALENKLGDFNAKGINILANFERQMKEMAEMDSCSDEMRVQITEKLQNVTELLAKVYKITKSHTSNDVKKEKIEELLGNVSIIALVGNISSEIEDVRNRLSEKAKNIAEAIKTEATQTLELAEEKEEVEENEVKVEERLEETKVEEKVQPEQNSLVEYKKTGFIDNLRRIMKEGKEKTGERIGFFSAVRKAFTERKAGALKSGDSKNVPVKQKVLAPNINKLVYEAANKTMTELKDRYNETLTSKEVTPNIIAQMAKRTAEFSKDRKVFAWCKGVAKDVFEFANDVFEKTGEYVIDGLYEGKNIIKKSREKSDEITR